MAVAKLPVATTERNRLVADPAVRGLFQRFQNGRRTFVCRFSVAGRSRQVTLVATKVADARVEAGRILVEAKLGRDIIAEKTAETLALRGEAKAAREVEYRTIARLAERYLAKGCSALKPRTYRMRESYLRVVLRSIHDEDAEAVKRARLMAVLDDVAETRGAPTRNRALSALSACLGWAAAQGLIERVVTVGIKALPEKSRERVLSFKELRAVWDAAGELGAFGAIVRLLMLTASRRDEVAELEWPEIDLAGAMISLPGERTKNKRPHLVPLAPAAVAILDALPHRPGTSRVFAAQTWSRAKPRLDALAQLAEPFVLHDLRRSCVTGMADIGVLPHVVEAAVNHVSGHKAGVAGVYNRSAYATEKRIALQRWADHLLAVEPAKVVPLPVRR